KTQHEASSTAGAGRAVACHLATREEHGSEASSRGAGRDARAAEPARAGTERHTAASSVRRDALARGRPVVSSQGYAEARRLESLVAYEAACRQRSRYLAGRPERELAAGRHRADVRRLRLPRALRVGRRRRP